MKANILFDIFFLTLPQLSACGRVPTHILVTRVGPCHLAQGSVVRISEMRVARVNYDVTVSGQVNVSKDIPNGWRVEATMQKCMDIRNIDTCDLMKRFSVIDGGCTGNTDEQADLSATFFRYTHPRMSCPIAAGIYTITDYPHCSEDNYLTVAEAKLSTSMFGYTLRLEGLHGKRKIMCIDVYLRLLYIRENKWLGGDDMKATTATVEDDAADDSNVEDDSDDEDEE